MGTGLKKSEWAVAWGAEVLMLAAVQVVCAQAQAANGSAVQVLLSLPRTASVQSVAQEKILREIDDLQNGNRWLLVRDDAHPGGPGRMVLVAPPGDESVGTFRLSATGAEKASVVVHAGDRLIVEEHTARVDATLEARALASAAQGAVLNVRLTMSGKVMCAVVLGPGRAALQPETGMWP
jgi:hypothetical protein